jgi:LEA14-like dessication related protein
MKARTKYIIAGAIGVVSIAGALAYLQAKKIMNYTLKFMGMRKITLQNGVLSFNIYYDYTNKADIDVTLLEQEYEVYVNDVYITTLKNYAPNVLKASQTSEIGIGVELNLKDLSKKIGSDYAKMVALPSQVRILTVMKWKVKVLGFIKMPVKYPYEVTLKEILGWYAPNLIKK